MELSQPIGIGLRQPHYEAVLHSNPLVGWMEVHSENFFDAGGPAYYMLEQVRQLYPISLHGVGLSLGSADGINHRHLSHLKELTSRIEPFLISEHLSWNAFAGAHVPDLLPMPYTQEAEDVFVNNIMQTQEALGRAILIENPSSYLQYHMNELSETAFLVESCKRSGAKILLDVNNIYVSCANHGWDPLVYIEDIPVHMVGEIHLAGHSSKQLPSGETLRIDTHNNFVCQEVWELYRLAIARFGVVPTLLEWDADLPTLDVLVDEAHKAVRYWPDMPFKGCANA